VAPAEFLSESAYCPLPTLVQSARELFKEGKIRSIHRARAATAPAVWEVISIAHEAARTRTRRLVLLTGVPGAGKTLVGLRVVHAPKAKRNWACPARGEVSRRIKPSGWRKGPAPRGLGRVGLSALRSFGAPAPAA
jgi:hypothetical protein